VYPGGKRTECGICVEKTIGNVSFGKQDMEGWLLQNISYRNVLFTSNFILSLSQ
jgi:hypothetical protein